MTDDKWAMLCKLVAEAFDHPDWVWERKHDGLRMRLRTGWPYGPRLTARSGSDKTANFPEFAAFQNPDCVRSMAVDGEMVSADGLPFQEFVQRRANRTAGVVEMSRKLPARLMAFDLLELDGEDLSRVPFERRRQLLLLSLPAGLNRMVEPVSQFDSGVDAWNRALKYGWEGVVGKRLDGLYEPGRRGWLKVKVWKEGVFEVFGYTEGTGKRKGYFGALKLSVVENQNGTCDDYRGEVGTGFDEAELKRLTALLKEREYDSLYNWVYPFKVRVKYCEVTNDGRLRFPVYIGQEGEAD